MTMRRSDGPAESGGTRASWDTGCDDEKKEAAARWGK